MVMVVLFCIKEIYVLWKLGVAYFYNGWNYLAVFNYWIYFIGFGFRVTPFVEAERLGFPPPLGTYKNYEPAFVAAQNWKFCMAINSVLVWMRTFEHLRMFPFMGYIVRVLAAAVSPLLVVSISFVVVTFSFGLAYVLAFAGGVHGYRTLDWTITSMTRQLRGMDDFDELWEENRLLGPMYYMAWTIIGAFIFVSLFVVVLLEEVGDISKQFNMEAIVKVVAKAFTGFGKGKSTKEAPGAEVVVAGNEMLTGIHAELAAAVKKQADLEGRNFDYGRPQKEQTSLDKLFALLKTKAKAANTDYCDITKQHFRELEETVQKVIDAADELNSKIGKNPPETAKSRVQTVASIRTLTGSVRSSSAAVQRITSARNTGTGVSVRDVSRLRAQLR